MVSRNYCHPGYISKRAIPPSTVQPQLIRDASTSSRMKKEQQQRATRAVRQHNKAFDGPGVAGCIVGYGITETAPRMCLELTTMLPCGHGSIRKEIISCGNGSASGGGKRRSSGNRKESSTSVSTGIERSGSSARASKSKSSPSSKNTSCPGLRQETIQADPAVSPRCPLPDCAYEEKRRCWECCSCGKGWNMTGRCIAVHIWESDPVPCEHVCCEGCKESRHHDPLESWEQGGYLL
ncbi:hypothetical protein B0H63DRAFT_306161 [Podospora didyma]|uniref:Uncharacterized protein n=1 Tax=Podospora didyma TaxID=330526 RepID=A0AAE0K5I7_9PEZI|nr:hypothetical protein B0H63DRAFT_306161 [Podospora didyma]